MIERGQRPEHLRRFSSKNEGAEENRIHRPIHANSASPKNMINGELRRLERLINIKYKDSDKKDDILAKFNEFSELIKGEIK